jgi:nucleoid DNA-binding protein
MNKTELANLLAKQEDLSPGRAADELDRVVFDILKKLRSGKAPQLPGAGKLLRAEGAPRRKPRR